MRAVDRNPDQPRTKFDQATLEELAASIRANGLLQPIVVRKVKVKGGTRFQIVAGERRWRAHKLLRAKRIKAEIADDMDDSTMDAQAIIENLQREDISQLEEARAYQRMLDRYGYTVEELAKRLGIKQPWRITERTSLLSLRGEYQDLLARGQIGASQAYELSRLSPANQDVLFRAIRSGQCRTYDQLRAQATALVEAEAQSVFFAVEEAPAPSAAEVKAATRFEAKIGQVAKLLRQGISENEVVAVKKVDPTKAGTLADLIEQMQKDLKRIELGLRQAAITGQLGRAA
jgi:ParB family chromosome partitioning protein